MGFFSDLFDAICDIFEDVPIIGWGLNAIRAVKDWVTGTDELDEAPAYNQDEATVDEKVKYNELLANKRDAFVSIIADVEKRIQQNAKDIFLKFLDGIEGINTRFQLSISVEYVKNEIENYNKELKGGISDLVNRRLTLSDSECIKILGHEAGEDRSMEIEKFLKKIVKEGSQSYTEKFETIISWAFSLVKNSVTEKVSEKATFAKKAKEELENLNRDLSLPEKMKIKDELEKRGKVLDRVLM